MTHENFKQQAIELRKSGNTYSEILKIIPVAKSTVSLWLREVGLSRRQYQRLTQKKIESAKRGGAARKKDRLERTAVIDAEADKDIGQISKRELMLMGAMLYWAEGGKEKEGRMGSGINFSNSDPYMIRLFLKWLFEICEVERDRLRFGIYIHENSKHRIDEVIKHWSKWTGFSKKHFRYVYYKKHNPKTKRKNIGATYFGNLRISITASSILNRKTMGWVKGVNKIIAG